MMFMWQSNDVHVMFMCSSCDVHVMAPLQVRTVSLGEMVRTNVSLKDTFNHSRSDVFSTDAGGLEVCVSLDRHTTKYVRTYVCLCVV